MGVRVKGCEYEALCSAVTPKCSNKTRTLGFSSVLTPPFTYSYLNIFYTLYCIISYCPCKITYLVINVVDFLCIINIGKSKCKGKE